MGDLNSICGGLDTLSVDILEASSAKPVKISREHAQRSLSNYAQTLNLSPPQQMQLRSQEIAFRIRRIYIDAPDLKPIVYGCGWVQRRRMSGVLKLVSLPLGSMSPNHRCYEITKAEDGGWEAIMKARKSKNVLFESLGKNAKNWLDGRGFKNAEDINELVTIVYGFLGKLMHILY